MHNVGSKEQNYTKQELVELIFSIIPKGQVRFSSNSVDRRDYRVSFDKITSRVGFRAGQSVESAVRRLTGELEAGCYHDFDQRKDRYGNYSLDINEINV